MRGALRLSDWKHGLSQGAGPIRTFSGRGAGLDR